MKNLAHSILVRLANLCKEHHLLYNDVLMRYLLERIFYRVGVSEHSKNLILKGGNLFVVWQDDFSYRPTMDADMLFHGDASPENLLCAFRQILALPCEDGVIIDLSTLKLEPIREDTEYGGSRITFVACLGATRTRLQIDIGVGDLITPQATFKNYPTLLDFPVPRLRMYPPETTIAEKFETMVQREMANSRMKDFYDIWILSRRFSFDSELLRKAISNTFNNRGTRLPERCPYALTDEFANNPMKQTQWKAFLRKSHIELHESLSTVIKDLRNFLEPIVNFR